ncbi:aspartate aminotransferase family protein [Leuconostocaceae bacterium ESL0958]|nr:aspartate aminotransferase family protein [Leuconostocaceae bacterium ESL0958]
MSENQRIIQEEDRYRDEAARIKYYDLVVDSAKGAILTDADGQQYLDLLSSASATNLGHCHPKVTAAIHQQVDRLLLYTPAYFANTTTAPLLKRLAALTPGNFEKKVALGNAGSDANEMIVKAARAYTGRQYVISFTGSMHGSTYGAASLSGVTPNQVAKIGPMLPGLIKATYPDPHYRLAGESDSAFSRRMFADFERLFSTYIPVDEVALVLIEPIQCDGGLVKAPQEFMDLLYQFTRAHGIVFATDEVNQGLGRCGKMWSIDYFGIEPDMVAVGKSLASGLPLSAAVGRAAMMDAVPSAGHLFTTGGSPVAAAAAMAGLDVLDEENLVARSASLGQRMQAYFDQVSDRYDFIGDYRFYGFNGGIDIVDAAGQPNPTLTNQLMFRLYELGAIIISLRGNILRFQPPLVMTDAEVDQVLALFDRVFAEAAAGSLPPVPADRAIGW